MEFFIQLFVSGTSSPTFSVYLYILCAWPVFACVLCEVLVLCIGRGGIAYLMFSWQTKLKRSSTHKGLECSSSCDSVPFLPVLLTVSVLTVHRRSSQLGWWSVVEVLHPPTQAGLQGPPGTPGASSLVGSSHCTENEKETIITHLISHLHDG